MATSLHYMNPYQPNDYVQAITTVGTILAYYGDFHSLLSPLSQSINKSQLMIIDTTTTK